MAAVDDVALRCAVHPARLAADRCPVCDRPRCAPDVTAYGATGCPGCVAAAATAPPPPAQPLERAVRAGLAALATGVVFGAAFASEYVDVHLISLVAPALVGLGCGAAASLANRGQADRLIVVMSLLPALLGTALGFRLQPGGGQSVVSPAWEVGPPYLAAVLGTAAWPLLFGPPRRPRRRTRNQRDGDGDGVGEVT